MAANTQKQIHPTGDENPSSSSTASSLTITSTLPLPNTNYTIPRLGFGLYKSPVGKSVESCLHALSAGYRHIDSAQLYENEAQMGEAVVRSGIPRDEVFLTTKILSAGGSPEKTYKKCVESVERIDPGEEGYVDLFLIHAAVGGPETRKEMWLALERLYEEGKAKAIGVSNFGVQHVEEMKGWGKVWPPHVNQLELHPWCQQRTIVSYCHKHSIVVEAYSPLVRGQRAHNATLVTIAENYKKTYAQILIRYSLQKGWIPLPKSNTKSRIEENKDVFGWEIKGKDMDRLDALDEGDAGAIVHPVKNEYM